MNETQYPRLREKYGKYSSWAIWNHEDEADPTIIESHIEELNANHVFVAYNASRKEGYLRDEAWANFRGWKHDRKLKYACNDTNDLRGSYLTDLFKGIKEPNSAKVRDYLTQEVVNKNVSCFLEEMLDIGTTKETVYVVLGVYNSDIGKQFRKNFLDKMGDVNDVIYYTHYSNFRLTDEEWVEGLWKELGINANYETIRQKYK
jgi:hypothetical protein